MLAPNAPTPSAVQPAPFRRAGVAEAAAQKDARATRARPRTIARRLPPLPPLAVDPPVPVQHERGQQSVTRMQQATGAELRQPQLIQRHSIPAAADVEDGATGGLTPAAADTLVSAEVGMMLVLICMRN